MLLGYSTLVRQGEGTLAKPPAPTPGPLVSVKCNNFGRAALKSERRRLIYGTKLYRIEVLGPRLPLIIQLPTADLVRCVASLLQVT